MTSVVTIMLFHRPFVNLGIGIGIGIGTGITDANIFTSIRRSMNPKLTRVVTLDEEASPTKPRDTSISWSRDK